MLKRCLRWECSSFPSSLTNIWVVGTIKRTVCHFLTDEGHKLYVRNMGNYILTGCAIRRHPLQSKPTNRVLNCNRWEVKTKVSLYGRDLIRPCLWTYWSRSTLAAAMFSHHTHVGDTAGLESAKKTPNHCHVFHVDNGNVWLRLPLLLSIKLGGSVTGYLLLGVLRPVIAFSACSGCSCSGFCKVSSDNVSDSVSWPSLRVLGETKPSFNEIVKNGQRNSGDTCFFPKQRWQSFPSVISPRPLIMPKQICLLSKHTGLQW